MVTMKENGRENKALQGLEVYYANLLEEFIPEKEANILVCGGGTRDLKVFKSLGYSNVHVTGMDLRFEVHGEDTPKFENAEDLSFEDNLFDYSIIQAAVHHTSLPNKVITELYRVSKKGCFSY